MANDDIISIFENGLSLRLVETGLLDQETASEIVGGYFAEVREAYGGTRYMIKRGYRRYTSKQIAEIKSQYNGSNAAEIQRRYQISRSTLYRYLGK